MSAPCPSTLGPHGKTTHQCRLPLDHDGRHAGNGAYWWHGNGETCTDEACHICAMNGDPA